MNREEIKQHLLDKYPDAIKESLEAYLDVCLGKRNCGQKVTVKEDEHHILPKSLFPQYKNLDQHPWNRANLGHSDHLWSHYWLSVALPSCVPMQHAFFNMCNLNHVKLDQMPAIAEQYQVAREAHAKAIGKMVTKNWEDPEWRAKNLRAYQDMASQTMKGNWEDQEFIERHKKRSSSMLTDQNKDPGFQSKRLEALNKKQSAPGYFNDSNKRQWTRNREKWLKAQEFYDKWIELGKPGGQKFATLIGVTYNYIQSFRQRFTATVQHEGKEPWVPKEDPVWMEWVSEQK